MIDDDIQEPRDSIGNRLKAAREGRELSIGDVAGRLHLDSRVVTHIEEDNFDALPDPIYVRGYIRNYSKLLGIDADELLAIYEAEGRGEEPEIIPEIKYPTQSSSSDKPVKAFTYLLTLGLVILLIAWWQSSFIVDLQTGSLPARPVARAANPALIPVKVDAVPRPVIPLEDLQEIALEPYDIDMGAAAPAPGASVESTVPPPAASRNAAPPPAANPPAANRVDALPAQDNRFGLPPVENLKKPEPAAPGGDIAQGPRAPLGGGVQAPDLLVLNVSADSWIEITDAMDRKIYFDLARTGDVLNLHGIAPFDVLLGFAQGVTIKYNGDSVDQSPYTRAGVARFTLGD